MVRSGPFSDMSSAYTDHLALIHHTFIYRKPIDADIDNNINASDIEAYG